MAESEKTTWEWLHRASTIYTLLLALLGGPAVTFVLHGALEAFSQPALPWWGDVFVAGLCSVGMAFVLIFAGSKGATDGQPKTRASSRIVIALIAFVLTVASFQLGRVYQSKAPVVPDRDLIANSNLISWGITPDATKVAVGIGITKIGDQAKDYSMVVIARIQDNTVDMMTDSRLDKSQAFPLRVGIQEIDADLSEQTTERIRNYQSRGEAPVVGLFVIALPKKFTPKQIDSLESANNLGAKIMQAAAVGARADGR